MSKGKEAKAKQPSLLWVDEAPRQEHQITGWNSKWMVKKRLDSLEWLIETSDISSTVFFWLPETNCDVLHFVTLLLVRQKTIKSDAVVVAASNLYNFFFGLVAETCIAYGRNKFLNIGVNRAEFGLRAVDLVDNCSGRQFDNPTWLAGPDERRREQQPG